MPTATVEEPPSVPTQLRVGDYVVYQWTGSDPGFEIESPNSSITRVNASDFPGWALCRLKN